MTTDGGPNRRRQGYGGPPKLRAKAEGPHYFPWPKRCESSKLAVTFTFAPCVTAMCREPDGACGVV